MDEKLIISIKEFRSITGSETAQFSDKEVAEIIQQLDVLALMHIKRIKEEGNKLEGKN